ncbi:MAG: unnamed protein product [uncultured Paraburkholderia sp.]|nr:MAG: unnamed protein product [uncultured Paraburkholderia sp.]
MLGKGGCVEFVDPYVEEIRLPGHAGRIMSRRADTVGSGEYDAVVIACDHDAIDYDALVRDSKLIIDACG